MTEATEGTSVTSLTLAKVAHDSPKTPMGQTACLKLPWGPEILTQLSAQLNKYQISRRALEKDIVATRPPL